MGNDFRQDMHEQKPAYHDVGFWVLKAEAHYYAPPKVDLVDLMLLKDPRFSAGPSMHNGGRLRDWLCCAGQPGLEVAPGRRFFEVANKGQPFLKNYEKIE